MFTQISNVHSNWKYREAFEEAASQIDVELVCFTHGCTCRHCGAEAVTSADAGLLCLSCASKEAA